MAFKLNAYLCIISFQTGRLSNVNNNQATPSWRLGFNCFCNSAAPVAEWFKPQTGTCETSQVLLAGVPGSFSSGSHIFATPTD